jgi:putative hydrolase of the HAD superfamily
VTEAAFMGRLSQELTAQRGDPVELDGFGERYFRHLQPNERLIDYMRELRGRGYKMAICTNNVKEWESRWRAMLPVDEIFDVVVDSAFVGSRKPEPRIYEITLERLGSAPEAALFVDDVEDNCQGARALGINAIRFRSTDQAIEDIEAALAS